MIRAGSERNSRQAKTGQVFDVRHYALAFLAWAISALAHADELRLDAGQGAPQIEATINGRSVRLIVDTTLPALAILTPDAAQRLGVRRIPIATAQMELDGDAVLRGRIGRPEIVFANGRARRTVVTLLRAQPDMGADGLIGPGALGYDNVRFVLNADADGSNARTIPLQTASRWLWNDSIGDHSTVATIDLGRRESLMGRRLAQRLVESGVLLPAGGVRRTTFRLGIGMNVQTLTPGGSLAGPLGEIIGHTDDELFPPQALEEDVIVVEGQGRRSLGPNLYLGRSAFDGCREINYDLSRGELVLSCGSL